MPKYKNREARRLAQVRYKNKLKRQALEHYGLMCYKCGEQDPDRLELHHPNGDGNKDRAEKLGKGLRSPGGWNFLVKLRKLGWPSGYVTICISCHDLLHGRVKNRMRLPPGMDNTRLPDVDDDIPF